MNEPEWVEWDALLAAHREMVKRFGGIEGLRDSSLLESAMNRPQNRFAYEDVSILS